MKGDLIIYGAGGAGRELAFSLSLESDAEKRWLVKAFVDDDRTLWGKTINKISLHGGFEWLSARGGAVALTTVGNPAIKRKLAARLKQIQCISFPLIIGPNCIVSESVEFGEGCIVAHSFNYITTNIKIGDFVFINCSTRIGHDVSIGDYTTIFSNIDISGGAQIGSDCIIGSGVTINPEVKIGNGSIIGAGSVVAKDIPAKVVAAGVPARVIKEIKG